MKILVFLRFWKDSPAPTSSAVPASQKGLFFSGFSFPSFLEVSRCSFGPLVTESIVFVIRFRRLGIAKPYCAEGLGGSGSPKHIVRKVWAPLALQIILGVRTRRL